MRFSIFLMVFLMFSCINQTPDAVKTLDEVSIPYVKLVLGVGQHDPAFVDAYYGPEAYAKEVEANPQSLEALLKEATQLSTKLKSIGTADLEELIQLRHRYLSHQLVAVEARIKMLQGDTLSFDEESRLLYDAIAPQFASSHFDSLKQKLESKLPGSGSLSERYNAFVKAFEIPKDILDSVFTRAIEECRARTEAHLSLPEEESFKIEYVTDKPWSGYNWYQGKGYSLIQVNTDLPIYIDRAIDLACHEGYPGHHTYNALLEKHLVDEKGWVEFSVYPLFSPQSLIAEGTANFGIKVAFPGDERIDFEASVLFPMAGIDSTRAVEYYDVLSLADELNFAHNEAARNYLDGKFSKEETKDWLVEYGLMSEERALQRISFIETYRSYVINYNWGQALVQKYIESKGGTAENPEKRWEVFGELLASPRLPSGLQ